MLAIPCMSTAFAGEHKLWWWYFTNSSMLIVSVRLPAISVVADWIDASYIVGDDLAVGWLIGVLVGLVDLSWALGCKLSGDVGQQAPDRNRSVYNGIRVCFSESILHGPFPHHGSCQRNWYIF